MVPKSRFALKIRKHCKLIPIDLRNCPFFIKPRDTLIVETNRGEEIGVAVKLCKGCEKRENPDNIIINNVIRLATKHDLQVEESVEKAEHDYFLKISEYIQKENLLMKIISCELTFSQKKLTVYYRVNDPEKGEKGHKPNFKQLGKDLYNLVQLPVELRDTGNRGEAKVFEAVGSCGHKICCTTWLSKGKHVSIKMAKEQSLPINILKLSGQCGKLLCCLEYELDNYQNGIISDLGKKNTTPAAPDQELNKIFSEDDIIPKP